MSPSLSLVHRISCGAIAVQAILACCQPAFAEGLLAASSTPAVSAEQGLGDRFDVADLQRLDAAADSAARVVQVSSINLAASGRRHSMHPANAVVEPARRGLQAANVAGVDLFAHTRHATPLLAAPSLDGERPLRPMSGLAVGMSPAYSRSAFFSGAASAR